MYVFYDNNNNNNGKLGSRKQVIKDQETKRIHELMTRSHARLNDNSLARKQQKQLHQKDREPDQCALVGRGGGL